MSGAAPYFRDGRYASLEEMLAKTAGTMDATRDLSEHDRDALVAFLRAF